MDDEPRDDRRQDLSGDGTTDHVASTDAPGSPDPEPDRSGSDDPSPESPTSTADDWPTPRAALVAAWDEHRRYVYGSAGLFAIGIVIGALLGAAGYDLLALIEELTGEHPFGDIEETDIDAQFFIVNNSIPFFLSIVGFVTLGLLTAYIMVFNGVIVGNVSWFVGGAVGVDFIVVGLVPHGVFELTALFMAAGVGFRLLHRLGQRVFGRREAFVTKPYLYQTALFVLVAWLLLVVAAFVEAYVTGAILEFLFSDRLDDGAEVTTETAAAVAATLT